MASTTVFVDIDDLNLWNKNPRMNRTLFDLDLDEESTIKELLSNQRSFSKLMPLAKDILDKKSIMESFIVYKEEIDGEVKLLAYDGNRRLLCFKLSKYPKLMDDYNLNPEVFHALTALNLKVKIDLYETNDEKNALLHVKRRHNGLDDGPGQLDWESENKSNIAYLLGEDKESIGNQILSKFEELKFNPSFSKISEKLGELKMKTTLDRIFNSNPVKKEIFKLERGVTYDLDNPSQVNKVAEVLTTFFEQPSINVSTVYDVEKIKTVFREVKPIIEERPNLFTKDKPKQIVSKNNKYKSDKYLFDWTKKGLNIRDMNFNNLASAIFKNYYHRSINNLNDFELVVADVMQRILLENAIRTFCHYYNENANVFNMGQKKTDFDALFNVTDNTSLVTTKRLVAIIELGKLIKNQYDTEIVKVTTSRINKLAVNKENYIESYVNDLHCVMHGVKSGDKNRLLKSDSITLAFIELINSILNLTLAKNN